jgi:mono/diheme cytochrome c family protein
MPAWSKTLNDGQIWQLVTFLSNVQKLPPAVLKELAPPGGAVIEVAPPAPTTPAMQMH